MSRTRRTTENHAMHGTPRDLRALLWFFAPFLIPALFMGVPAGVVLLLCAVGWLCGGDLPGVQP